MRWTEPFDATEPGAAPPQVVGGLDLVPGMVPARQSEDCLTAEVWTPSLDGLNPVIVWVPGGSYRIGGASLPTYDGTRLAELSTVVVGVNYRLGALGWLAADGVPSNLGLRDLLAALTWVREVAPVFGGDPDRVVVMGESAGAGMIAHLLAAMPRIGSGAPQLSGAIVQSGAVAGTLDAPTIEWVGEQLLDAAGVRDAAALARPAAGGDPRRAGTHGQCRARQGRHDAVPPWIDGDLLDAPPFRAPLPALPLIVGTNANEMELFRDQVPRLPEEVAVSFLARKASSLGIDDEARVRAGLRAVRR